jgi:polyphosphate glucokinase
MSILGIDIGGSGIKGALVDVETGQLLTERYRLPTPEGAEPDAVAQTVAQICKNFEYQGKLGIGFPAVVQHGVALTAANISGAWIDLDADQLFTKATGCSTYVVNDADAAGVAEMKFGAGREYQKGVVLILTIGTGIGSALFTEGVLVPNTELGHMDVEGKEAERRASDAIRKRKNLSWEKWANRFNKVLDNIERIFYLDLIILGGGISKDADEFIRYLDTRTKVVPAQLLNTAGIVGAAMFAREEE